jgi:hypothetical protein
LSFRQQTTKGNFAGMKKKEKSLGQLWVAFTISVVKAIYKIAKLIPMICELWN